MSRHQSKEKIMYSIKDINEKFKIYTEISELSYGIVEVVSEEINDNIFLEKHLKEIDKKIYQFKNNKSYI